MLRKLLGVACALALATAAFGQTADELLDKHNKAIGGAEKIKALHSVKMAGTMTMGPVQAPFTIVKARPDQLRLDFTIQGMTASQAYDGKAGWMVMPFGGNKDPQLMTEDMIKQVRDEADFDGPMFDYKAKGNKVEYVGKEDVQGSPAFKLKVTTKSGNESMVYLDADSYLPIRSESKHMVNGREVETETTIGDYKQVEGMMFPFSIESRPKGAPAGQSVKIETIELNPKVDVAMFHMPEVKKAAEPEKKAEEPAKTPDKKP